LFYIFAESVFTEKLLIFFLEKIDVIIIVLKLKYKEQKDL